MEILFLVDYDNQKPSRFGALARSGRSPNLREHEIAFQTLRTRLIEHVPKITSEFANARMRLYGGWTDDEFGSRTDVGAMVATVILRHGRTRLRNVRMVAELAETLLQIPDAPLYRTLRQSKWRGERLSLREKPAGCADIGASCGHYETLRSWALRERCPDYPTCNVKSEECVEQRGQKLVDTMIVADTVSGAIAGQRVIVVSRDDDVVPGILAASRLGGRVTLIRVGRKHLPGDYDELLAREGIDIDDYPDVA
jgi:uncharacterized LabA/DUF88 family protein